MASPSKASRTRASASADDAERREYLRANMELALETPDCLHEIFASLTCSLSLRRAQATCRAWRDQLDRKNPASATTWKSAWLTVPVRDVTNGRILLTAEHALRRAPAGENIMLAAGTDLMGDVMIAQHLHVRCEEGVHVHGRLVLHGGSLTTTTLPGQILRAQTHSAPRRKHAASPYIDTDIALRMMSRSRREDVAAPSSAVVSTSAAAAADGGIIENLKCLHYNDEAVVVNSGLWQLQNCSVHTSKKGKRACTAVHVREGATLKLDGCDVSDCSSGISLERPTCKLVVSKTSFLNLSQAILTLGGGHVEVSGCSFARVDIALKIDDRVSGFAQENVFGEGSSVFGRWARAPTFKLRDNNTYISAEAQAEVAELLEEEAEEEAQAMAMALVEAEKAAAQAAARAGAEAEQAAAKQAAAERYAAQKAAVSQPGKAAAVDSSRGAMNGRDDDDDQGDGYFQAERLVARKLSEGLAVDGYKRNTVLYLVRWLGYAPEYDSWEPAGNITPELIAHYNAIRARSTAPTRRPAPRPPSRVPARAANWLEKLAESASAGWSEDEDEGLHADRPSATYGASSSSSGRARMMPFTPFVAGEHGDVPGTTQASPKKREYQPSWPSHMCNRCGRTYTTADGVKRHARKVHPVWLASLPTGLVAAYASQLQQGGGGDEQDVGDVDDEGRGAYDEDGSSDEEDSEEEEEGMGP